MLSLPCSWRNETMDSIHKVGNFLIICGLVFLLLCLLCGIAAVWTDDMRFNKTAELLALPGVGAWVLAFIMSGMRPANGRHVEYEEEED